MASGGEVDFSVRGRRPERGRETFDLGINEGSLLLQRGRGLDGERSGDRLCTGFLRALRGHEVR